MAPSNQDKNNIWYKVVSQPTKYGTSTIGRRAAENALHAIRYADALDRAPNLFITINFHSIGIDDESAAAVFQDLKARLSRWWRYQRTKGLVSGALVGVHSHANPAGSRHAHWMVHVPPEVAAPFQVKVEKLLLKIARVADLRDGLDVRPVYAPGSLAKYILRGIDPMYAGYLHIRPANEGIVTCRRTGVSRAIGKLARQQAGWRRVSRGRPNGPRPGQRP